ncbi:MAG: peptidyl-alpha-hydroxyglycine alpha-amidating lyase family protein [Gemmataceae bacterium]|nr:peptidyl-alpha-hydroxyglycine alpha-amidating lyase family protein [Gemmataceae bacterium]
MMQRFQVAVVVLVALAALARAQENEPKYPRVNVATIWTVDAKWPQRPAAVSWGNVPGIAVDERDHVYVFTRAEPPVQVYDAGGKYLRGWGKGIGSAHHIKIDRDGFVWIADMGNHVVEKYTPEGKLLVTIGTKGKAGRDTAHLNTPCDMAVAANGDVYVADGYGNARVIVFDKTGKFLREWGELGSAPGQFSIVHAIATDSKGRVYVADRNNVRIQVFSPDGKFLEEWKNLIVPWGFHMTKNDELWVCGSSPMQWRKGDNALGCPPKDQIFMKLNTQGKLLHLFALPKGLDGLERPGEVNWVHCIAFDSKGSMYLGDIIGKRAQKFVLKTP